MVMKDDVKRPSTAAERARMRELLRQGLHDGAVGMSAGLEYEPGRWSTTDEIVEMARELPAVDGIYISHERSEGSDPLWYVPSQDGPTAPTLLDAVRETIAIGEKTGARVVASHLKAKGEHYWGSSAAAVTLIQRARDRGVHQDGAGNSQRRAREHLPDPACAATARGERARRFP